MTITLAPASTAYLMVGMAALIRESSVILHDSSSGTLKSTLISALFPLRLISFMDLIAIMMPPI
jgi:hypothetical protein